MTHKKWLAYNFHNIWYLITNRVVIWALTNINEWFRLALRYENVLPSCHEANRNSTNLGWQTFVIELKLRQSYFRTFHWVWNYRGRNWSIADATVVDDCPVHSSGKFIGIRVLICSIENKWNRKVSWDLILLFCQLKELLLEWIKLHLKGSFWITWQH